MSLLGSVGKTIGSIGGILNNVTGVTSSAKQAQKYTQQNMATSQGMTLEQMAKAYEYEVNSAKNAIQWQMQDLKNAGLNPILAAGYGGANLGGAVSGGMGAPSGSTGTSGGNPLDLIQSIASAKNAISNAKLAESQALKTDKEAGWIDPKTQQDIAESKSRIAQNHANSAKAIAETTATKGTVPYNVQKAKEGIKKGAEEAENENSTTNSILKTMLKAFYEG